MCVAFYIFLREVNNKKEEKVEKKAFRSCAKLYVNLSRLLFSLMLVCGSGTSLEAKLKPVLNQVTGK